ncbi:DUF4440 domain-containing protein [Stenotrophomonas sp. Iso1]|uniref:DUF4440 domain-containing protein n=1 Tax=Stenotrophomonas sp. Iso1 TaxID=2977283 RepID=UPI002FCD21CE
MASGPPTSAALAAELVALERMLHAPSVRGDVQRLANLLDEAFSEIGCSGRCYSRAQMLRHLPEDATDVNIEAECFVVTLLAAGLA